MVQSGGVLILTSHRILWHARGEARALQAQLSLVAQARKSRNIFKPSKCVGE